MISLLFQTFLTTSPYWRINNCRLSDSNPQPLEALQLVVPSRLFVHDRERCHVIYIQKITTYGAPKTVLTVFLDFTAIVSITLIFFTNEDSHGFSRVNPKVAPIFSRVNLVSFSLFASESFRDSLAKTFRETKNSTAKRWTQSWH